MAVIKQPYTGPGGVQWQLLFDNQSEARNLTAWCTWCLGVFYLVTGGCGSSKNFVNMMTDGYLCIVYLLRAGGAPPEPPCWRGRAPCRHVFILAPEAISQNTVGYSDFGIFTIFLILHCIIIIDHEFTLRNCRQKSRSVNDDPSKRIHLLWYRKWID